MLSSAPEFNDAGSANKVEAKSMLNLFESASDRGESHVIQITKS